MVVLSTRVAKSSRSAHADAFRGVALELNGTLHGNKTILAVDGPVPAPGEPDVVEGIVSYFDTSGRLSPLGKVSGSFGPNEATDVPPGELPNLSNLTLELSNHAGSVQLTLSPSLANEYHFHVSGGTGSYTSAHGSGTLTLTFQQSSNEYLLRLTSSSR